MILIVHFRKYYTITLLFGISTFQCLTKHSKRVKQKTFSPAEKIIKQNRTHSTSGQ